MKKFNKYLISDFEKAQEEKSMRFEEDRHKLKSFEILFLQMMSQKQINQRGGGYTDDEAFMMRPSPRESPFTPTSGPFGTGAITPRKDNDALKTTPKNFKDIL